MVSEEKNQEMSVNEILSSIKEVISNEKVSKNIDDEDEIDQNSKEDDEESLALTQSYLTNIGGAGFMSAGLQSS